MTKNYVDDKAMERRDENEMKDRNKSYEINEKRRTGYIDGEDPSMRQEFPGEEIVEDLRELSRQDEHKEDDPTFLSGENVKHEKDRQRYGDSISKTADKEFQQKKG
ncbi:hypothetical protein [Neobacillus vireti]|uniref:hypothetical protein n=1 Tax=Neobacillus vireti TaxID=220686 RepID=UPI00300054B6